MRQGADNTVFSTNWGKPQDPTGLKSVSSASREDFESGLSTKAEFPSSTPRGTGPFSSTSRRSGPPFSAPEDLGPLPQPPEEVGLLPQPFHFQVLVCFENDHHLYWRHFFLMLEVCNNRA